MTSPRSHAELVTLRKLAHELSSARKERMTSIHLLAAIAAEPSPASELLRERRLDQDSLLKASRSFDDEGEDPIGRAMNAAREMAQRGPTPEPSAIHLLLALLADRGSAAHRSLVQSGVDLSRLRASAMQMALGVIAARRGSSAPRARAEAEPPRSKLSARGTGKSSPGEVGSSRVDLQACKLEYSIVSPK